MDSSQTGVNDSSCWEGGYSTPCLSLNLALKGAQHYNHSITILLQPGQHQLHSGSETQLRNMSQLAIVGNGGEGEVVIKCLPLAGLLFLRSNNITMKNLKIISCGALQNSVSKRTRNIFLRMQSAIFCSTCKNVQLINVHVTESNGTGVVLYNPLGVVNLDMCNFTNNSLSAELAAMLAGGGGLVIEANAVTSQFHCTIANSAFVNNTAKSRKLSILSQATNPSEYFCLGGGISVVFRGETANNTVQLTGVKLENNTGQFGGGLFLAFFDSTSGNVVTTNGIEVTNNTAMLVAGRLLPFASGGGILIDFVASEVDYPFNNTVEIRHGKFISNTAQLGGGLAVDVVYDAHGCVSANNKLLIENCNFGNNKAYQGSSAYFLGTSLSCRTLLNTTLSFSNFTDGHCACVDNALPCLGSVLLSRFPLALNGSLLFSGNTQSALCLTASSIELLPSTQLQFINNSAINGAALHVVDCSSVIVNDGTSLYFKNNTASNHGGAIYSEACTQTRDCFIRHSNSTLDPDQWKTNVTFIRNQAYSLELGSSIYMDSIQSCVWAKYKNMTFCWKGWFFANGGSCLNQLGSDPAYITNNGPAKYTVYPGECINLRDFTVFDYWDSAITERTILQVDVLSGATRTIRYNEPDCQCYSPPEPCIDPYARPCYYGDVAILSDCGDNYTSHVSQILIHPPNQPYGIVLDVSLKTCDNGSSCVNTLDHPGLCFKPIILYEAVCTNYNCIGKIVCGSCATDGGMFINVPTFSCISCENAYAGVGYFLIEIALVMFMMVLLTVLHINITNGNLNAYILYSQMVTLQFPTLGYTAWLPGVNLPYFIFIPLSVYSIWNLNFLTLFPPFCIPNIRTAVDVIFLQYVIAACPLLFIIVSYTWIQCYNNGYRLVVYTTRPVHRLLARFWQKFKIQPSLIDTYAGLLLLAYMRLLAVSVKLLLFIRMDQMFSSFSPIFPVPLSIIPTLCLLVFAILPMAVLLLYPFKIFQRCLTCCRLDRPGLHALVDAYQGCFKNSATDGSEGRYFSGIYLLFRFCYVAILILFLSPAFTPSFTPQGINVLPLPLSAACLSFVLAGLVLILRPYKKVSHNAIDFLTLFLMAVFAALSGVTIDRIDFIIAGPLYLPFLCLVVYLIYRMFKCCCCTCVTKNSHKTYNDDENNLSAPSERQLLLIPATTSEVVLGDYVQDDLYPDRIVNPGGYT